MTLPSENNFLSRLKFVLSGRKIFPWSAGLGISSGSATHLNSGKTPNTETLVLIARAEHLSIHWLLTGDGAPYLVYKGDSDLEIAEHLGSLLHDEPDQWTIHMLNSGSAVVLLLTQPGQVDYKNKPIDYTICETISGPIASKTLALLRQQVEENGQRIKLWRLAPADLQKLADGEYGPYHILGDKKHPAPLTLRPLELTTELDQVSEAAQGYYIVQNVAELDLIERFRSLSPEKQQALLNLIDS